MATKSPSAVVSSDDTQASNAQALQWKCTVLNPNYNAAEFESRKYMFECTLTYRPRSFLRC